MNDYIKKTSSRKIEHYLFNRIPVHVKEQFEEEIDLDYVLKKVESIPEHFFYNIELILVGDFDIFHKMETNAAYDSGAIYISNKQSDEEDMIDDIVHELAHAVEEQHGELLYSDGMIENEFLGKREKLYFLLKAEGYEVEKYNFLNSDYDRNLDFFFYEEVGYPLMTSIVLGLFYSPYAATSLREYFANGFENYFLKNKIYLKKISLNLYNKIEELIYLNQKKENYNEF